MMIQLLQHDPGQYFAIVLVVVVSIVLHELGHGIAAIWQGDRTPIETGHMTLNPLVHMGGISLVLLFVIGIAWGLMPVNPSRFRSKYGDFYVSAAGPLVNLILAAIGVIGLGVMYRTAGEGEPTQLFRNGSLLLETLARMNVALLVLNLLPVPPLDGSRMLGNVLPAYRRMLQGDAARGFMMAALFAVFIGGGRFIFLAADYATFYGSLFVAGAWKPF